MRQSGLQNEAVRAAEQTVATAKKFGPNKTMQAESLAQTGRALSYDALCKRLEGSEEGSVSLSLPASLDTELQCIAYILVQIQLT